ncbi:YafY family transcriptional regulator [Microbacterium sp. HD4P20]|uniref:helix-turn-helix transcriptional regulator n=1 Tax=Microbacterium sp. HD4P20 TaxID=2864874 RepID=UPI001C63D114|nr:YafY family protein [Microbacterium sp. HD4P20]MCP2636976.1 YafY family transcriptional regulator [Microbacterium sp. HD4P20]
MPGPTSRLLSLLSLLQTPRTWAGSELAERLRVTHRTVRRDVDRLREMGYPVEADLGVHGGYRLVAGTSMPPLLFEDDEAVAVALGVRTIAAQGLPGLEDAGLRALAKLSTSLPSRLRHRVRNLGGTAMTWRVRADFPTDPDVLTILASATSNSERVRMQYERRDGERGARHIEPRRLVSSHGRWYLVAFDVERDGWRTFRVDRIREPRPTGAPARNTMPDEDVLAHLEASERAMESTYRADIILLLPLNVARERLRDHVGDGDLTAEGDVTRWRSAEDTAPWLAIRLLLLGCAFHVNSPPALRTYLDAVHERTAPIPL